MDFGRFCTGFLVVMGVGTFFLPSPESVIQVHCINRRGAIAGMFADFGDWYSSPGVTGTLGTHQGTRDGNVDYWGTIDLWNYRKLYDVFSRKNKIFEGSIMDMYDSGTGVTLRDVGLGLRSGNTRWFEIVVKPGLSLRCTAVLSC